MPKRRAVLFVYGTLRRGGRYHGDYLRGAILLATGVTTRGRLYDTGHAYPALVLSDNPSDVVVGELYRCPPAVVAHVDQLEGYTGRPNDPRNTYECVEVTVHTTDGDRRAWVYVQPAHRYAVATPIPHGDWLRWVQRPS